MKVLLALILAIATASAQLSPYADSDSLCQGKQVIVHLFEWSWDAIGRECEEHLGPMGYCAVQISPPMEHIQGGAWWTRYQPVSYNIVSRSGDRQQFADMVQKCEAAGVHILIDGVINHMSGYDSSGVGTAGNSYDGGSGSYPGVPYSGLDFHERCTITNYQDANNVRNCCLGTLNDLDHSKDYVRGMVSGYLNDLVSLGAKAFRFDASKHMWPGDLQAMQDMLVDVDGNRPLVIHEVISGAGEAVSYTEYLDLGKITEFGPSRKFPCLRGGGNFNCLLDYGPSSGFMDGLHALTFVDNHDNQRDEGAPVLNYKEDYDYKIANAFHLGHEYGFKRVMSSYYFDSRDQGPPGSDANQDCGGGWVCEHRWSSIGNLVQFANAAAGTGMGPYQVQDNGETIGWSRGEVGFIAIGQITGNTFDVPLPDGDYCDIVSRCQQTINVSGGRASFTYFDANEPVAAICVGCS